MPPGIEGGGQTLGARHHGPFVFVRSLFEMCNIDMRLAHGNTRFDPTIGPVHPGLAHKAARRQAFGPNGRAGGLGRASLALDATARASVVCALGAARVTGTPSSRPR